MSELELKFCVPHEVVGSLRSALAARGARRVHLRGFYFDSEDGLLSRQGIALRLRQEGRAWVQTVKAAGDSRVNRLEHEVPVRWRSSGRPLLDLSRHDGTDAGTALRSALAEVADVRLIERHASDVWRLRCPVRDDGGTELEVALDLGNVSADGRSEPLAELEIEHIGGPARGLFDLAAAWSAHGGLWLSTVSKSARGERLREPGRVPATKADEPSFGSGDAAPAMMRAMLLSALDQVLGNASEVAEGSDDADHIHQLRVGLRRLRTLLRELAELLPAIDPGWDAALSETFAKLGERRDQEAVAEAVRPMLESAGAPKATWATSSSADTAAAVRSSAFQGALVGLLALAYADDNRFAAASHHDAKLAVTKRLDRLHRRVTRQGRRFDRLVLDDQHRVRKQLKRLRYLAEFARPAFTAKAVDRYLARLRPAQDALGAHNDCAVAASFFRGDAEHDARAWFAVGWLQAHLAVTAQAARKALRAIDDDLRFWRS